jgi:hypothetical protein
MYFSGRNYNVAMEKRKKKKKEAGVPGKLLLPIILVSWWDLGGVVVKQEYQVQGQPGVEAKILQLGRKRALGRDYPVQRWGWVLCCGTHGWFKGQQENLA